jgi:hypothetical protein
MESLPVDKPDRLFSDDLPNLVEPLACGRRRGALHTHGRGVCTRAGAWGEGVRLLFDSNAILLFLAEKTGQFLPETAPQARGDLLSWLMFVATGVGPFSGQAVHFRHFAPEPSRRARSASSGHAGWSYPPKHPAVNESRSACRL